MSEQSLTTNELEQGAQVLLRALAKVSDEGDMKIDEYHVGFYYPDTAEELVATVRLTTGSKSIFHPGIYRFGKPELSLCKKIHFAKRNDELKTQTLFDLLLFLKEEFLKLDLEVRLVVCLDADRKTVVNMEGVKKDGSQDCYRFHLRT